MKCFYKVNQEKPTSALDLCGGSLSLFNVFKVNVVLNNITTTAATLGLRQL